MSPETHLPVANDTPANGWETLIPDAGPENAVDHLAKAGDQLLGAAPNATAPRRPQAGDGDSAPMSELRVSEGSSPALIGTAVTHVHGGDGALVP